MDAVRVGIRLVRKRALDLDLPIWDEDVLNEATDAVIEEFDEELGTSSDSDSDSDSEEGI